jgi:hypothetical protein
MYNIFRQESQNLIYKRVDILPTYGKHLHDPIISLRGEDWAHKTSLNPPFVIKMTVYVPSHESK